MLASLSDWVYDVRTMRDRPRWQALGLRVVASSLDELPNPPERMPRKERRPESVDASSAPSVWAALSARARQSSFPLLPRHFPGPIRHVVAVATAGALAFSLFGLASTRLSRFLAFRDVTLGATRAQREAARRELAQGGEELEDDPEGNTRSPRHGMLDRLSFLRAAALGAVASRWALFGSAKHAIARRKGDGDGMHASVDAEDLEGRAAARYPTWNATDEPMGDLERSLPDGFPFEPAPLSKGTEGPWSERIREAANGGRPTPSAPGHGSSSSLRCLFLRLPFRLPFAAKVDQPRSLSEVAAAASDLSTAKSALESRSPVSDTPSPPFRLHAGPLLAAVPASIASLASAAQRRYDALWRRRLFPRLPSYGTVGSDEGDGWWSVEEEDAWEIEDDEDESEHAVSHADAAPLGSRQKAIWPRWIGWASGALLGRRGVRGSDASAMNSAGRALGPPSADADAEFSRTALPLLPAPEERIEGTRHASGVDRSDGKSRDRFPMLDAEFKAPSTLRPATTSPSRALALSADRQLVHPPSPPPTPAAVSPPRGPTPSPPLPAFLRPPLANFSTHFHHHPPTHRHHPNRAPSTISGSPDRNGGLHLPRRRSLVRLSRPLAAPLPLPLPPSPTAWVAVEHAATQTLVIALQGSDSLAHWRINAACAPEPFERASVRASVHAGVYAAARVLLPRIVPLVRAHVRERGPNARVALAGHSLGGAVAHCLALLLILRGELPPASLALAAAFGAPAAFCERSAGGPAGPRGAGEALLSRVGLSRSAFPTVCFPGDVVPRLLSADAGRLSRLALRLAPALRGHPGMVGDGGALERWRRLAVGAGTAAEGADAQTGGEPLGVGKGVGRRAGRKALGRLRLAIWRRRRRRRFIYHHLGEMLFLQTRDGEEGNSSESTREGAPSQEPFSTPDASCPDASPVPQVSLPPPSERLPPAPGLYALETTAGGDVALAVWQDRPSPLAVLLSRAAFDGSLLRNHAPSGYAEATWRSWAAESDG